MGRYGEGEGERWGEMGRDGEIGPSIAEAGTRRSSKKSSAVSCAFMPIFLSFLPFWKPAMPSSTRKRDTPCAPFALSVLAQTMTTSHNQPFVMKT